MTGPVARRGILAGLPLALACPALAQPARLPPFAAAFAGWMHRHGIAAGSVALSVQGRLVVLEGFGGQDPGRPVPVWSLSKYVTGLAVARLAEEGWLGFDTPLAEAARALFAAPGAAQAPIAAVTVGQALTHRSGLPQAAGDAAAQGFRARTGRPAAERMAPLLALRPRRAPGQAYDYANVNFLLAGLVVEAVAEEPYGAFVDRVVLGPLGVRPRRLHPAAGVLAAAGGLSLSGPEYLALLVRGMARDGLVAPAVRRWMEDPAGKAVAPGSPVFYSLGLWHRPEERGLRHWHGGNWQVRAPSGAEESSGTFAARGPDGSAWFAAFQPYPGPEAQQELERVLGQARRQEDARGRPDLFGAHLLPSGAG